MATGRFHLDINIDSALLRHSDRSERPAEFLRDARESLVDEESKRPLAVSFLDLLGEFKRAPRSANLTLSSATPSSPMPPLTSSSNPFAIKIVLSGLNPSLTSFSTAL